MVETTGLVQGGFSTVGGSPVERAELEQEMVVRLVTQLEGLVDRIDAGLRPADIRTLDEVCSLIADEMVGLMARQEAAVTDGSLPENGWVLRALAMDRSTVARLTSVARHLRVGLESAEDQHLAACQACLRELCVALLVHQQREAQALAALAAATGA